MFMYYPNRQSIIQWRINKYKWSHHHRRKFKNRWKGRMVCPMSLRTKQFGHDLRRNRSIALLDNPVDSRPMKRKSRLHVCPIVPNVKSEILLPSKQRRTSFWQDFANATIPFSTALSSWEDEYRTYEMFSSKRCVNDFARWIQKKMVWAQHWWIWFEKTKRKTHQIKRRKVVVVVVTVVAKYCRRCLLNWNPFPSDWMIWKDVRIRRVPTRRRRRRRETKKILGRSNRLEPRAQERMHQPHQRNVL